MYVIRFSSMIQLEIRFMFELVVHTSILETHNDGKVKVDMQHCTIKYLFIPFILYNAMKKQII